MQKGVKTMQFDPQLGVFDPVKFTKEHPLSPEGILFTYFPSEEPETPHYHDFFEIGYCESGTGLFYVDGGIIPFSGRCCSIIYGGQVHIAQSINAEKSLWHFLYIDLGKLFSGYEALLLNATFALHPQAYDFPSVISWDTDAALYKICESIMVESSRCREGYLAAIQGLVVTMLIMHGRYMKLSDRPYKDSASLLVRLEDVLTYIGINYMNELTINEIAEVAHTSKSSLQRDMIAFTGMAPMQYVHHLRLNYAAAMLLDRNVCVSEIAFTVGYNTLSCFNRKFQGEFGMSPSQWRTTNAGARKPRHGVR
jgi:AraC-like DNA-binding protein